MTHRDGFPRLSARSAWRGDAGHREPRATPSESLVKPPPVARANRRGRRQALTMPRIARGLPPTRRIARAISMGHYQRSLILARPPGRDTPPAGQSAGRCFRAWRARAAAPYSHHDPPLYSSRAPAKSGCPPQGTGTNGHQARQSRHARQGRNFRRGWQREGNRRSQRSGADPIRRLGAQGHLRRLLAPTTPEARPSRPAPRGQTIRWPHKGTAAVHSARHIAQK